MDSSDLDEVFVSDGLEEGLAPLKLWEPDVDGGSHGCAKVGWARGDVSKMFVVGEGHVFFDLLGCATKPIENFFDTSSWLHGNNSKLIFFVNPNQECFVIIVENSSSTGPLSVEIARF